MGRDRAVTLIEVAFLVLTILGLTWGSEFDWPDYVHVNYGFPFVWATHVLNTIAGPVDKWLVDIVAITLDLVFWLGLMIFIIAVVMRLRR